MNPKKVANAVSEYGGSKSVVRKPEREFGLFSSFRKKTSLEAVDPNMHPWDAEGLMDLYKSQLLELDPQLHEQVYVTKEIAEIPENMIRDCFQNHFLDGKEVTFNLNDYNKNSYEFAKNINDEYMQVITNHSVMNSFITTREIIYTLQKQLQLQNIDPQKGSGDGDPDSDQGRDNVAGMCNNMINSKSGQKKIDAAKAKALEKISEVENQNEMAEALAQDEGEQDDENQNYPPASGKNASKGGQFRDIVKKFDMMDLVKDISLDNQMLSEMVKESLESTINYFSHKFKEYRESILTAENISEIINAEYAVDELFLTHLEDIETTYRKYKMKLDVYIDVSGSMSTEYKFAGKRLNCLDICKLLTVKLKRKGMVNDIYIFNTGIYKRNTLRALLNTELSGGTNLELVIQNIIKTQIPSFIITDACDSIFTHTDLVYFLTVGGGSPSCNKDVSDKYRKNGQGISYMMDNTFKKLDF